MEGEVVVNKWVFYATVIVLVIVLLYFAKSMWKKEGMSDSDILMRDRMLALNLQMDPRNSMKAVREGMATDPVLIAAALK